MKSQFFGMLMLLLVMTVLTGLVYPLFITALAQVTMPYQANGSLILSEGKVVGSTLIGQKFTDPKYFHGRPSVAGQNGYDGSSSGGSNLGPTSKQLIESIQDRAEAVRTENGLARASTVPADLVTASGSGLDPDITPSAAFLQVQRIASARNLDPQIVHALVERHIRHKQLGVLGEARVNVLELNIALDSFNK